jgi:hypothetical protein
MRSEFATNMMLPETDIFKTYDRLHNRVVVSPNYCSEMQNTIG